MKNEPCVKEIRRAQKAHEATPIGQLEALFAEETRWRRKATIAENKLASVRERINGFALGLVEVKTPAQVLIEYLYTEGKIGEADVPVRLDGKVVGVIKNEKPGWRYYPKGQKQGGDLFPTLSECQRSLEPD